jgi:hypothetical protein
VAGLSPEEFALSVSMLLQRGVSAGYVTDLEEGAYCPRQGVSVLDDLEARIRALEEELCSET